MAETFEIVVNQTPGELAWNFEELKTALAEKVSEYENVVYTEDKVKDAKTDLATLRKLKKDVDTKRKQIKNEWMIPYSRLEYQVKELIELIDKPISEIEMQVNEYEKKRRDEIRSEIIQYMDKTFHDGRISDEICETLKKKIYDSRWENATTTKKTWKAAIEDAHGIVLKELDALSEIEDEFMEDVLAVYKRDLVLADALAKANELRRAKERILEAERKRQEEERIRAERMKMEEEQRRQEEEMRKAQPEPAPVPDPSPQPEQKPAEAKAEEPPQTFGKQWISDTDKSITLKIIGTEEQLNKIQSFITYTGAKFVEVV